MSEAEMNESYNARMKHFELWLADIRDYIERLGEMDDVSVHDLKKLEAAANILKGVSPKKMNRNVMLPETTSSLADQLITLADKLDNAGLGKYAAVVDRIAIKTARNEDFDDLTHLFDRPVKLQDEHEDDMDEAVLDSLDNELPAPSDEDAAPEDEARQNRKMEGAELFGGESLEYEAKHNPRDLKDVRLLELKRRHELMKLKKMLEAAEPTEQLAEEIKSEDDPVESYEDEPEVMDEQAKMRKDLDPDGDYDGGESVEQILLDRMHQMDEDDADEEKFEASMNNADDRNLFNDLAAKLKKHYEDAHHANALGQKQKSNEAMHNVMLTNQDVNKAVSDGKLTRKDRIELWNIGSNIEPLEVAFDSGEAIEPEEVNAITNGRGKINTPEEAYALYNQYLADRTAAEPEPGYYDWDLVMQRGMKYVVSICPHAVGTQQYDKWVKTVEGYQKLWKKAMDKLDRSYWKLSKPDHDANQDRFYDYVASLNAWLPPAPLPTKFDWIPAKRKMNNADDLSKMKPKAKKTKGRGSDRKTIESFDYVLALLAGEAYQALQNGDKAKRVETIKHIALVLKEMDVAVSEKKLTSSFRDSLWDIVTAEPDSLFDHVLTPSELDSFIGSFDGSDVDMTIPPEDHRTREERLQDKYREQEEYWNRVDQGMNNADDSLIDDLKEKLKGVPDLALKVLTLIKDNPQLLELLAL